MKLLVLAGAAALRLHLHPYPGVHHPPELKACVRDCAGARSETESAHFTQCWYACELPTGDAARTGDVAACLSSCVAAGATAELGGDDWLRAEEHAVQKAHEEMVHQRFDAFWDKACEAGSTEGCRTVPEHVAKIWVRLEEMVNNTREEGRQYLLRQPEEGFAAGMERLNADLAATTLKEREKIAQMNARLYLWKKENPRSSAVPDPDAVTGDLDAAAAELSTEAQVSFHRAQTLMLKEKAEQKAAKKLEQLRELADKERAKAEQEAADTAAREEWTDEQKAAAAESIRTAWKAAHAAAAEGHEHDVREKFTEIDKWWRRGEEFRESVSHGVT